MNAKYLNKHTLLEFLCVCLAVIIIAISLFSLMKKRLTTNINDTSLLSNIVVRTNNTSSNISVTFRAVVGSTYTVSDINERQLVQGKVSSSQVHLTRLQPTSYWIVIQVMKHNSREKKLISVPKDYVLARSSITRKPILMDTTFQYFGIKHSLFSMRATQYRPTNKEERAVTLIVQNENYSIPVDLNAHNFSVSNADGTKAKIVADPADCKVPRGQKKMIKLMLSNINNDNPDKMIITYDTPNLILPIPFLLD